MAPPTRTVLNWSMFKAPVKIYRRFGPPSHLYNLGMFYTNKWALIFLWWLIPYVLLLGNLAFNRVVCSLTQARSYPVVDGLCAGTYLRQDDNLPWYFDLWATEQQTSSTTGTNGEMPPYIQRLMTGPTQLFYSAQALNDQIAMIINEDPTTATADLSGIIHHIQSLVDGLYQPFQDLSRTLCMKKDEMNQGLNTFINIYSAYIFRSKSEDGISAWTWVVVVPWWDCLTMFQRHTGSRQLPASRVYRSFVFSEIRFQMKRLIEGHIEGLDTIHKSLSATQQGLDLKSLCDSLYIAIDATESYLRSLDGKIFKATWPFLKTFSQDSQEIRKRCERMRDRLREILRVIKAFERDSDKLRSELTHLHTAFGGIAKVDLVAEGVVTLPRAFTEQLGRSQFSWMRQDWDTDPDGPIFAANNTIQLQYDLAQPANTDSTELRSALMMVCNNRTISQRAGGAIHMICALQKYAAALSSFDEGLIQGVQRSWLRERLEAQQHLEESDSANTPSRQPDATR